MILASHIIFTGYGFWLPNDPRGSWSDFVRCWEIFMAGGPATTIDERRSVAARPHDAAARRKVKEALQYPPVRFDGHQALSIAKGFAAAVEESEYSVYACSILPDHVHLVVARHTRPPKRIAGHLKGRATQQMAEDGRHPFQHVARTPLPMPWAQHAWAVFLDTHEDVRRAIKYVEENPVKMGLKRQRWSFVVGFGD
jgi:REP element-mobilizing transposase RayT